MITVSAKDEDRIAVVSEDGATDIDSVVNVMFDVARALGYTEQSIAVAFQELGEQVSEV